MKIVDLISLQLSHMPALFPSRRGKSVTANGGENGRSQSDIMSTRLLFFRRGFAYATEYLLSSQ